MIQSGLQSGVSTNLEAMRGDLKNKINLQMLFLMQPQVRKLLGVEGGWKRGCGEKCRLKKKKNIFGEFFVFFVCFFFTNFWGDFYFSCGMRKHIFFG